MQIKFRTGKFNHGFWEHHFWYCDTRFGAFELFRKLSWHASNLDELEWFNNLLDRVNLLQFPLLNKFLRSDNHLFMDYFWRSWNRKNATIICWIFIWILISPLFICKIRDEIMHHKSAESVNCSPLMHLQHKDYKSLLWDGPLRYH